MDSSSFRPTPSTAVFRRATRGLVRVTKAYVAATAPKDQWRARIGISDFCLGYPRQLTQHIFDDCGFTPLSDHPADDVSQEAQAYARHLANQSADCLFLFMDAFEVCEKYRALTGRGYGLPINRRAVCNSEDDYLRLVELFYSSAEGAVNLDDFERRYYRMFCGLLRSHRGFADSARLIAEQLDALARGTNLRIVDIGFQFTFALFSWASARRFGKNHRRFSYHCYTVYPWLEQLFHGRFFTIRNRNARAMEARGKRRYLQMGENRAIGAFVGFAVGDALGAPVAGLTSAQVRVALRPPVRRFRRNPTHPLLGFLRPGQFTGNTQLLLFSAKFLMKQDFVLHDYAAKFSKWGRQLLGRPTSARWIGPTTTQALLRLSRRVAFRVAGSSETHSCAAIYRIIPFAIANAMHLEHAPEKFTAIVAEVASLTHRSAVSRTGAVIYAHVLANLVAGGSPEQAVHLAFLRVGQTKHSRIVMARCAEAVNLYGQLTPAEARRHFGTSSNTEDTVPLAIALFLMFRSDFELGVIAAANSYRVETPAQRRALAKFNLAEQLVIAKGGNTDGIAALTGALIGAANGHTIVPRAFLDGLERCSSLVKVARGVYRLT